MKPSAILLGLFALATAGVADKVCTPSFDYCAKELTESKGFTEDDLKETLKGSEFENEDVHKILFHCKNPGIVGHPKMCASGCADTKQEGSHGC